MATKNISPVAPKEIQRICQLWRGDSRSAMTLAAQGKTNYYQVDLLIEVISLIVKASNANDQDRDQLRQVEKWILSNVKWTIDEHRGQELDRSKPLEKG